MKEFFKKHWLKFAGIAAGAVGGYAYYHCVGCLSGTCPITSNPWRITLYGAIVGFLLFDMFKTERAHQKDKNIVKNDNPQQQ